MFPAKNIMDYLIVLIPLAPLIAAACIGVGHFAGVIMGEVSEKVTARIATTAITLSCLIALILLGQTWLGPPPLGIYNAGQWLQVGQFNVALDFMRGCIQLHLAALFAILLFITIRFSVNYMHREAGFHRFFMLLCLFAAAMLWLVLSGNAVGTFMGWEIAGLCSYLLIAYFYERPVAATNATRVFITNRLGDVGFILGISLSYSWLNSTQWIDIQSAAAQLPADKEHSLALCFTLAALVKSAQFPFTFWLTRAMEGPTPSSAVFYGAIMIHAGVYLIYLLRPLLEHTPLVMGLLAIVGLLTALYSFFVGLTQTDIKSALAFSTTAQVGLMFLECGLGWWTLASWHLGAHAVVRGYQFLAAPSLMHNVKDTPIQPVNPLLGKQSWAYHASLQRGWLEPLTERLVIHPVRDIAYDLRHFDNQVIDRLLGVTAPTLRSLSSFAQREEQRIGAHLDNDADTFASGSGLAGKLTQGSASLTHWFEQRFVLRNQEQQAVHHGRALGHVAHKFEQFILRPRNLVLLILILLLNALTLP